MFTTSSPSPAILTFYFLLIVLFFPHILYHPLPKPKAQLKGPPAWWLASSTQRTYSTGQQQFILYVQLHNLYNADGSIISTSQPAILSWVASLGSRVQPKTIKLYLTAVRSLHTDANLPFDAIDSPLIQCLLHGMKRYHRERERKPVQPITLPALSALLAQLRPGATPSHTTIYATCCLTYAGLLRSSKFTTGKGGRFNPSLNLSWHCITFFPNYNSATHMHITLPASKTNPFHKGITVTVVATPGYPTCPVTTLKALFSELPHNHNAPLFEQLNGKPLSYTFFIKSIQEALTLAGLRPDLYAGHSFQ
ncbi:Integrase/recombinase xerD like protein [Termitomyces sp. T112]|nr:Integrase/recombinase xerD like protein [Termitomyces sp. T112]